MASQVSQQKPPRKAQRSSRVCARCHSRKIRCDVQCRGLPCSACVDFGETCVLRKRRNARAESPPQWDLADPLQSNAYHVSREVHVVRKPEAHVATDSLTSTGTMAAAACWMHGTPSLDIDGMDFDFTTLANLETIFDSALLPAALSGLTPDTSATDSSVPMNSMESDGHIATPDQQVSTGSQQPFTEWQFLSSRGCYELPPSHMLKSLLRSYFRFVHPSVPMINEHEVWALWDASGVFSLQDFPLVVMRAMVFASAQFLDDDGLRTLGYVCKRSARIELYHRARFLMAFDSFHNPVAKAQASLLLTYFSPHDNRARVNSFWLMNAARYARIACANTFFLIEDPVRSSCLKRLWWSILFRDRIMSLGLRRSPIVDLEIPLRGETLMLTVSDFQHELGKSEVHSLSTQNKLIQCITSMCRLVQALTPGLTVLYSQELLSFRVKQVQRAPHDTLVQVDDALSRLSVWHDLSIRLFPSPITLAEDSDCTGSVSIAANMLFCYYAAAKFALELLRMLAHEIIDQAVSVDTIRSMEHAMNDTATRLQEIVHARLTDCLPISISAYMALPLVLQAINVTSARGNEIQERIETRRLEILQRILTVQHTQYDGTDFIVETLDNISTCAKGERLDEKTTAALVRERGSSTTPSYWPSLARARPRAFLRLLYRLDRLLCCGGPPGEGDPITHELDDRPEG